jgi:hypothetical protein
MDCTSSTITHGVPSLYQAAGTSGSIIVSNTPLFIIPTDLLNRLSNEDKDALGKEVQQILNKYVEIARKY